jgi:DNA (cytosine-5)-methyltransferase 1
MYVVFWLKGNRKPDIQKWTRPRALCPTHGVITAMQVMKKAEAWGRYRAQYVYRCPQCATTVEPGWLPAASAIDWTLKGTRIGDRDKPLSPKTMKRIERGVERYWKPLIVAAAGNTYDGVITGSDYLRAWPTDDALPTQTTSAQHALALPPLITDGIRGEGTVQSGRDPMLTQTTAQTKGVLIPLEGRDGKEATSSDEPMRTQTTRHQDAIVVPLRNHGVAKPAVAPIDTVSANGNHHALIMRNNTGGAEMSTPVDEVMRTLTTGGHQSLIEAPANAMLMPYYGTSEMAPVTDPHRTLTTVDRYALIGADFSVEDCEFRMLTPDEIKVGMAFARDYLLLGTKREQVKQSGNAVTPPAARDLGAAVIESLGYEVEYGWVA